MGQRNGPITTEQGLNCLAIFVMVFSRLKVEILFSWLWVKRYVFTGIKNLDVIPSGGSDIRQY